MKWVLFAVGLVLGAVGAFATVVYAHMNRMDERDDNIVFSDKTFADLGDMTVGISGTLTGPGLGYPNTTYSIVCYRERRECFYNSIEQIGKNQVGRAFQCLIGILPRKSNRALQDEAQQTDQPRTDDTLLFLEEAR
jgi:hypothetical protein